jgi:hypothetical protein
MHALRLAARVCARWSGEGLTQGWDALLLYAMQTSRTCEGLVLALECLVHYLSRSPAREEDAFARQGGYALVQDLLCSKTMSEELQLSCYTLLMHLLLRTHPPVGAVTPFPPDDSSIIRHPAALKVRVCVRACVRACVSVCVCMCVGAPPLHSVASSTLSSIVRQVTGVSAWTRLQALRIARSLCISNLD